MPMVANVAMTVSLSFRTTSSRESTLDSEVLKRSLHSASKSLISSESSGSWSASANRRSASTCHDVLVVIKLWSCMTLAISGEPRTDDLFNVGGDLPSFNVDPPSESEWKNVDVEGDPSVGRDEECDPRIDRMTKLLSMDPSVVESALLRSTFSLLPLPLTGLASIAGKENRPATG